jgi:Ca2+-transporting ATPase
VTGTGMETEIGRIAKLLEEVEEEPSPLAVKMDYIGKRLGIACLVISAVVMGLGIFRGNPILEMFIWAVSLAIAAVPEALAAVVTGALAIGVQRAAKRNAIVRRLPAVETLGCTTVICSDKTGTLTKNEMTIRQIYTGGRQIEVGGVGYDPAGAFTINSQPLDPASDPTLKRMLMSGMLCNDANLVQTNGAWRIKGDPTEGAFVVAAAKAKFDVADVRMLDPHRGDPFESNETDEHRASTAGREPFACVKVLGLIWSAAPWNGTVSAKPDGEIRHRSSMPTTAWRNRPAVGGLSCRFVQNPPHHTPDTLEADLTFLGLAGMIDPPREEVKKAIRECQAPASAASW